MVLHRIGLQLVAADTFDGIIVQIQMCQFNLVILQRVHIYTEAVILTRDLDFAGVEIFDRVIGAAMTEFQFIGRAAKSQC